MARSNIYTTSATGIAEVFQDYLEAPEGADGGNCIAMALSSHPLGPAARDALNKSFAALGFETHACTYATLLPRDTAAEGGDVALDAQALFALVEGMDPLRLVACDANAAEALGATYRTPVAPDSYLRLLGRPSVAFGNLESLMESDAGKQTAWRLLKTLSRT